MKTKCPKCNRLVSNIAKLDTLVTCPYCRTVMYVPYEDKPSSDSEDPYDMYGNRHVYAVQLTASTARLLVRLRTAQAYTVTEENKILSAIYDRARKGYTTYLYELVPANFGYKSELDFDKAKARVTNHFNHVFHSLGYGVKIYDNSIEFSW